MWHANRRRGGIGGARACGSISSREGLRRPRSAGAISAHHSHERSGSCRFGKMSRLRDISGRGVRGRRRRSHLIGPVRRTLVQLQNIPLRRFTRQDCAFAMRSRIEYLLHPRAVRRTTDKITLIVRRLLVPAHKTISQLLDALPRDETYPKHYPPKPRLRIKPRDNFLRFASIQIVRRIVRPTRGSRQSNTHFDVLVERSGGRPSGVGDVIGAEALRFGDGGAGAALGGVVKLDPELGRL